MSVKSGFFNSIEGDRVYNADDISQFFDGIISDGVFRYYKKELKVEATNEMSVRVLTGKAIVFDKYIENTAPLTLNITGGNSQPRYDAVVVGVDLFERTGDIYIKSGTPAASPAYPTMLDTPDKKEICLAYVYVPANPTSIVADNITDKRSDSAVCGWVILTNVSAHLKNYRNNYITKSEEYAIPITAQPYDANNDTLLVYKNGLFMTERVEYIVGETGSSAKIHLSDIAPANTSFDFVVLHLTI